VSPSKTARRLYRIFFGSKSGRSSTHTDRVFRRRALPARLGSSFPRDGPRSRLHGWAGGPGSSTTDIVIAIIIVVIAAFAKFLLALIVVAVLFVLVYLFLTGALHF